MTFTIPRRTILKGIGAAGLGTIIPGAIRPLHAASVAPITVVINQSPWFESFRKTVEAYEAETGNKVELDVNPFAGSLEKQRNSVRASEGQYDVLIMNSGWFTEMYAGGFVEAITDIDPGFKLDPDVYTLGDTIYYNAEKKSVTNDGKLMSIPVSPLIPMLYYRGDLYKEAGLSAPKTFAELEANARKLHNPPEMYGIVQRGARGPHTVAYDFYPYLYGMGGGIFKDQSAGNYSVTLNSTEGKEALDYYIRLAKEAGHPKTAASDQAEVIQAMVTGHSAHIMMVIAAWSQMDDPNKSAIVDKVEWAPPPSAPGLPTAPGLGHWLAGISKNVPDDRKRAAVEFLRWFQTKAAQLETAKAGGIPVNAAVYKEPIAEERKYRWMKPLAEALPHAVNIYQFPEASEVIAVLEVGLNRAVAGEVPSADALNGMSDEIEKIMAGHSYKTGKLDPIK
ncbi:multiple sugar transport system substrate-binding protein [Aminobacter lissarensis]|uniref:Multiple sugar transport system substrate-binding protein n=1 Tax=Aminobacter carboxidus TaxID=376165 RepID=A0A8E1WM80_9HYPH|nr:extracellular solute-binding protein [Aminobacter lissarensis]MBB6469842.1 multiple sugar transport system substrate-binding protein [Aminobacter lissarensis]